jgi:hypothetical protein
MSIVMYEVISSSYFAMAVTSAAVHFDVLHRVRFEPPSDILMPYLSVLI